MCFRNVVLYLATSLPFSRGANSHEYVATCCLGLVSGWSPSPGLWYFVWPSLPLGSSITTECSLLFDIVRNIQESQPKPKTRFDFSPYWLFPRMKMHADRNGGENLKQWLPKPRTSVLHWRHRPLEWFLGGDKTVANAHSFCPAHTRTRAHAHVTSRIRLGYFISVVLEWSVVIGIFSKLYRSFWCTFRSKRGIYFTNWTKADFCFSIVFSWIYLFLLALGFFFRHPRRWDYSDTLCSLWTSFLIHFPIFLHMD